MIKQILWSGTVIERDTGKQVMGWVDASSKKNAEYLRDYRMWHDLPEERYEIVQHSYVAQED